MPCNLLRDNDASDADTSESLQPTEPLSPKASAMLSLLPFQGSDKSSTAFSVANEKRVHKQPFGAEDAASICKSEKILDSAQGSIELTGQKDGIDKGVIDLPGLRIPIRIGKGAQTTPVDGEDDVTSMEQEFPTPSDQRVTKITYPMVKISWGAETSHRKRLNTTRAAKDGDEEGKDYIEISNSGGSGSYNTRLARTAFENTSECVEQANPSSEEAQVNSYDVSALTSPAIFPRSKPPPPTPPEQAYLPYSLSTPTLPSFHSISDPNLIAAFRIEREVNPDAFDAKTREIKKGRIADKVARGGRARLSQGDYNVELASREDAAKAERWSTRRNLVARLECLSDPLGGTDLTTVEQAKEQEGDVAATNSPNNKGPEYNEGKLGRQNLKQISSRTIGRVSNPKDSKSNDHPRKDTSSGLIRHQHSRTTEESEEGQRVVIKTWIEITQEIFIPSGQTSGSGYAPDAPIQLEDDSGDSSHAASSETESDSDDDSDGEKLSRSEVEDLLAELGEVLTGQTASDTLSVDGVAASMEQLRAQVAAKRRDGMLSIE